MKNHISKFQELKYKLFKSQKIRLIYRGDDLNNLYQRFGVFNNNSNENKNELLKRIFLIGDKSRYFYKDNILKLNQYKRDVHLTNSDDEIIDGIFCQINSAIKSDKEYLVRYFDNNQEMKSYFDDLSNREQFIKSINQTKDKFRYRNYYLTILHQLYFIEYRNNTHFVSTTTKYAVAREKFADNNNGVVIHCWQPIRKLKRLLLKNYNLPRQKKVAFCQQYERSIFGGIFPHYIIGVEFLNDNEFYFNSNIKANAVNEYVFMFGLNINQENFFEVTKKTKFRKSITMVGKRIYENETNY